MMQLGTQAGKKPLPPELWIQILRELPSHYQRSCLSVSKLFHDISLQYVFANVDIRLGLLKDHYLALDDVWLPLNNEHQRQAESAIRRSCELLRHISRSPTSCLSQAVKRVSVRAYSYDGESPPVELLDALEGALSILQLRAFAWYGCHPMPRPHVFEALSTGSGNTLEDIVLPAELLDHTPLLAFGHLKSLSFLNQYDDDYRCIDKEDPQLDAMRQTITVMKAPSLLSLGIFGEGLSNCNVQRLSTLVDLTLVVLTDHAEGIGAVFAHCPRLQSLTLFVGAVRYSDLAAVFRTHVDALPLLTAFSMAQIVINNDTAEAVAKFLETKPRLERLELGQQWDGRAVFGLELDESFLEVLPRLLHLRILALELSLNIAISLTSAHLLHLGRRIAHRLTALSLWVDFQYRPPATDTDWIQFLSELHSCRFLYISTYPHYLSTPGVEELQRMLFDHPPPRAELVGFNEDIRWVERRESETGQVAYSESWPLSKVYHRTAGDFGCEEWEWLMRHVDSRLP